jgi:hypothetical protein
MLKINILYLLEHEELLAIDEIPIMGEPFWEVPEKSIDLET